MTDPSLAFVLMMREAVKESLGAIGAETFDAFTEEVKENAELRAEVERLTRRGDSYSRQIDKVDEALPLWKGTGKARIETIDELRAEVERLRERLRVASDPRHVTLCDEGHVVEVPCELSAEVERADYATRRAVERAEAAEAEAEEWFAMYDKIPRHELGIPGMHFIGVHNRVIVGWRAEVERLRDIIGKIDRQCSRTDKSLAVASIGVILREAAIAGMDATDD